MTKVGRSESQKLWAVVLERDLRLRGGSSSGGGLRRVSVAVEALVSSVLLFLLGLYASMKAYGL